MFGKPGRYEPVDIDIIDLDFSDVLSDPPKLYTGYTASGSFVGYTGLPGYVGYTGHAGLSGYTGLSGSVSHKKFVGIKKGAFSYSPDALVQLSYGATEEEELFEEGILMYEKPEYTWFDYLIMGAGIGGLIVKYLLAYGW